MKKTLIIVATFLISVATFAQKNEVKAAETALKANNFSEAVNILKGAESLFLAGKEKQKAQYYLLLGKAYNGQGKVNEAATALNQVINIEKNGTKTYTEEAGAIINTLVQNIAKKASDAYQSGVNYSNSEDTKDLSVKKFGEAAEGFEQVYNLSPRDTAFLQNAAFVNYFAERYNKSIENYKKLLEIGYTGAGTSYTATSTVNGEEVAFNSKKEMDDQVKLKLVKDPKVTPRESQTIEMKKMIVKNLLALKQNDEALKAIKEAQQAAPKDYSLLVDEANVYYQMGDNTKFKEKLEEAVKINPNDYILHYNIGVMKAELNDLDGAIESYNKAIALKPDYADAYNNIGAAVLDKAKPIVEEMNKNMTNFKKYDELQAKQTAIYKEALPYFEKAFGLNKNNLNVVQNLLNIYQQLEMNDKAKEMKVVYDQLKG